MVLAAAQNGWVFRFVPELKTDPDLQTVAENPHGKPDLNLENQKKVRNIFVKACKGDSSFLQYLPELFRLEMAQMRMELACAFYHSFKNVFQGRDVDLLILPTLRVSLEHIIEGREAAVQKADLRAGPFAAEPEPEPEPVAEAEPEPAAEAESACSI